MQTYGECPQCDTGQKEDSWLPPGQLANQGSASRLQQSGRAHTTKAQLHTANFLLLQVNANLSRWLKYAGAVEGAGDTCGWRQLIAEQHNCSSQGRPGQRLCLSAARKGMSTVCCQRECWPGLHKEPNPEAQTPGDLKPLGLRRKLSDSAIWCDIYVSYLWQCWCLWQIYIILTGELSNHRTCKKTTFSALHLVMLAHKQQLKKKNQNQTQLIKGTTRPSFMGPLRLPAPQGLDWLSCLLPGKSPVWFMMLLWLQSLVHNSFSAQVWAQGTLKLWPHSRTQ